MAGLAMSGAGVRRSSGPAAVILAAGWLLAGPALACGDAGIPCVMDGRAFVDSVGVNTHFVDASTGYAAQAGPILALLRRAHIRHVRDAAIDADGGLSPGDDAARFRALAAAGIGVDFVIGPHIKPGFLAAFKARMGGAVESFELPNELNDGHDPGWIDDLRGAIRALRAQAGATPVVGPALVVLSAGQPGDNPYAALGDQAALLDFGNVHDYSVFNPGTAGWGNQGAPPCQATRYGSIAFNLCFAAAASGARPVMATEYGWSTAANRHAAVPEAVQARYIARGVLLHAMLGVRRTYLYQLMDAGEDDGQFMGLTQADATPKPAFTALASLLAAADDDAPGRPTPSVRLTGELADVRCIVLQRAHGPSRLVAWVEKSGFDPNARGGAGEPVAVAPQRVAVGIAAPGRMGAIRTMMDDGALAPQARGAGLVLTDRLTIVDLD